MNAAEWVAVAAAMIALAASVYAVPAAICGLMNRGVPSFSAPHAGSAAAIVVLLSGRVSKRRGPDGRPRGVLSHTCLARVKEAASVCELIAPEWIVSAGGLPGVRSGMPTCAELMRDELIRLGVPAERILVEAHSRTTREEAVLVARMLARLGPRDVVLVTSDVHMPRSLGAFRAAGVSAAPASAADPDRSRAWPAWTFPSAHGLRFSADLAHELLGLVWYRARGWLSSTNSQGSTHS